LLLDIVHQRGGIERREALIFPQELRLYRTVWVIIKAVRTHWICSTSARRVVIMVGSATLTVPPMIEVVSDPRITAKLIPHLA
jgi:hypothetical protein